MEKKDFCPCTKEDCNFHGNCRACVEKHRKAGQIPHCLFPNSHGDRSIKNFYLMLKKEYEK